MGARSTHTPCPYKEPNQYSKPLAKTLGHDLNTQWEGGRSGVNPPTCMYTCPLTRGDSGYHHILWQKIPYLLCEELSFISKDDELHEMRYGLEGTYMEVEE